MMRESNIAHVIENIDLDDLVDLGEDMLNTSIMRVSHWMASLQIKGRARLEHK